MWTSVTAKFVGSLNLFLCNFPSINLTQDLDEKSSPFELQTLSCNKQINKKNSFMKCLSKLKLITSRVLDHKSNSIIRKKYNKPALLWFVEQYQIKTSNHTRLQRQGLKQQAVLRGLSTSDRFSRKEFSEYRLKPPKYIP